MVFAQWYRVPATLYVDGNVPRKQFFTVNVTQAGNKLINVNLLFWNTADWVSLSPR